MQQRQNSKKFFRGMNPLLHSVNHIIVSYYLLNNNIKFVLK